MKSLNRNQIKYIAIAAMLIDHIAYAFVPEQSALYFVMRMIGRIAAPVMCYFLVEGFLHTSSAARYGVRLGAFALISQIPYSLMKTGTIQFTDWNMIATLLVCFLILECYIRIQNNFWKFFVIIILAAITYMWDWGVVAPVWVLLFLLFRENKPKQIMWYAVSIFIWLISNVFYNVYYGYEWYNQLWELGLLFLIPLIFLYNGEKGEKQKLVKWLFYYFYPIHIGIIVIIKYLI